MRHEQHQQTSSGSAYTYRPALDGVRALAVTAVLLFHGGVAALPGGFLGVDAWNALPHLANLANLANLAATGSP